MKKILSIVLIVAVAGAGAFAFMGSASATADGTSYASITKLHGESANGQVDGVTVSSTGYVEWESVSGGADHVNVTLEAKHDGEWHQFAHERYENVSSDSEGSYSYPTMGAEMIEPTPLEASAFSADEDGETRKQWVLIRVNVEVVGENGAVCEFSDVHKVKTKVTNLADPEAGGSSEIDGSIDMNETTSPCHTC